MRRVLQVRLVLASAILVPSIGHAQSLSDQIAAVDLAQTRQREGQRAAIDAQEREARRVEERRRAEVLTARHVRVEAEAQIATAARVRAEQAAEAEAQIAVAARVLAEQTAEEARVKAGEQAADKKRDQNHEDQLRELDIEARKLQLEAMKTRVSRENDYIDRELQREGAETDVTQSHADSVRNLSIGAKSLLERTGEAEVRAASRTTSTTVLELPSGSGIQQLSH